ncbi:MAG: hypothetical protein WC558_06625 [Patulibacter sp.]
MPHESVQRKQRGSHRGRRFAQQTMSSVSNNDLARRLRRKVDEARADDAVTTIASAHDDAQRDRKRRKSVPHRGYRARTQTA